MQFHFYQLFAVMATVVEVASESPTCFNTLMALCSPQPSQKTLHGSPAFNNCMKCVGKNFALIDTGSW